MASKRAELQRIRQAVDDRLAHRSEDFRLRVIQWLDAVDAELDGGVFDLHLAFAIHSVESEDDLRLREQQLEQMRLAYRLSVEKHGAVFQQFRESAFAFEQVRGLVDRVALQQEVGKKLDERLVTIHNAVRDAIHRLENSKRLVNRIALLGMVGVVGSLCFPAGWLLGKQRGYEIYGDRYQVRAAAYLWDRNPDLLGDCIKNIPAPCSVTLQTGMGDN